MLALALALVEAGLTLLPYAWARLQWTPPPDGAQTWLIFAGDSVTAGFGLPDKALAYPGVIQGDLRAHILDHTLRTHQQRAKKMERAKEPARARLDAAYARQRQQAQG